MMKSRLQNGPPIPCPLWQESKDLPHGLEAGGRWPRLLKNLGDSRVASLQTLKWRLRYAIAPASSPYEVFRRYGVIFVHIPKNAGSALRDALYAGHTKGPLRQFPHRSAELLRRLDRPQFDRLLSVAVLRDPRTRLVSTFNYLRNTSKNESDRSFARQHLEQFASFEEFATALPQLWPRIRHWPHFKSQANFVCDMAGRPIVDLLITVEKLDAGIEQLEKALNRSIEVGRVNISQGNRVVAEPELVDFLYPRDRALWQGVKDAGFLWLRNGRDTLRM